MRRRTLMRVAPAAALLISGCTTPLANSDREDSDSDESNDEDAPTGPAPVEIENHLEREVTVTLDIEGDAGITRTVPEQTTVSVESEITETGVHPLRVTTSEGHAGEYEWDVSDFALEGKGGLVIEVSSQGVRFLVLA